MNKFASIVFATIFTLPALTSANTSHTDGFMKYAEAQSYFKKSASDVCFADGLTVPWNNSALKSRHEKDDFYFYKPSYKLESERSKSNYRHSHDLYGYDREWSNRSHGTYMNHNYATPAVPEPSSTIMIAAGCILVFLSKRRRRNK